MIEIKDLEALILPSDSVKEYKLNRKQNVALPVGSVVAFSETEGFKITVPPNSVSADGYSEYVAIVAIGELGIHLLWQSDDCKHVDMFLDCPADDICADWDHPVEPLHGVYRIWLRYSYSARRFEDDNGPYVYKSELLYLLPTEFKKETH